MQEGPLQFLFSNGKYHLPRGRDIGMLFVVCDLEIPGPLCAFDPLASHQGSQGEVLLIKLDPTHHGVKLCLLNRFFDLFCL